MSILRFICCGGLGEGVGHNKGRHPRDKVDDAPEKR